MINVEAFPAARFASNQNRKKPEIRIRHSCEANPPTVKNRTGLWTGSCRYSGDDIQMLSGDEMYISRPSSPRISTSIVPSKFIWWDDIE